MSTILLEQQGSDGTGQRNGFTSSQAAGGLRRTSMFRKTQHIHLVGIGGSGMSGIAEVLLTLGYKVTLAADAHKDGFERDALRYHQAVGGIGRPDFYRPSRIPDRGGSGCGDFVCRFAAKPGGDGG